MKVKSYMIWPRYRGRAILRPVYIDEEQIDEASVVEFDVSREEFEGRIVKQAQEPPSEVTLVKLGGNKKVLVLIFAKRESAFCYEFQSELGAEMMLQLFKRTRRQMLKKP